MKRNEFCQLSVCMHVSVELQVIPWPRTSAVFTCFCKRKSLTVTTFLEKYDTRVIEGGGLVGFKLWGVDWIVSCLSVPSRPLLISLSVFLLYLASFFLSVCVYHCKVIFRSFGVRVCFSARHQDMLMMFQTTL